MGGGELKIKLMSRYLKEELFAGGIGVGGVVGGWVAFSSKSSCDVD